MLAVRPLDAVDPGSVWRVVVGQVEDVVARALRTSLLEERVGPAMDGGKWLCDPDAMRRPEPEQPGCLVYSVGSEKDTVFERAMVAEHGCEVHTFDHSVEPRWVPPPYVSYHRVGLGQGERMASLPQLVEKLGHRERVIDVLNVDCEGCEYEALLPLLEVCPS